MRAMICRLSSPSSSSKIRLEYLSNATADRALREMVANLPMKKVKKMKKRKIAVVALVAENEYTTTIAELMREVKVEYE